MAYNKQPTQLSSEEIFKIEVVKGYAEIWRIKDEAEFLDAVINIECFTWNFLESSDYPASKKKAMEEYEKHDKHLPKALGRALFKLQQREARLAGIFGKIGLIGVPEGLEAEEVIRTLNKELENPETMEE